jgi:hypothetical protein
VGEHLVERLVDVVELGGFVVVVVVVVVVAVVAFVENMPTP